VTQASCDVLVIGGGPAGSTISALLAERGRDVVMVEKSHHPRFHIGESLLPFNMPLFERLGVAEEIKAIGMPKYGAQFISPWHSRPVTYNFANAWDNSFPSAYQVRRSEFDRILFRNAARRGARAIEGCRVMEVRSDADGADVTTRGENNDEQAWRTRFVVDASGRDTFLASRLGMKRRNPRNNSAAIFGHFSGATRLPGKAEGNISLFWFDHGWFWFIPLSDGATSVGAVCSTPYMRKREAELPEFLLATIAMCPPLAARLRNAQLTSPVTATGNYSYSSKRATGRNCLLVGDAYAFVDPMFSSGVLLAMHSSFVGADTVEACLDHPGETRRVFKAYEASVRRGVSAFSWFIYRVMSPGMRYLFMNPTQRFRLQAAVLSVLAGDVYKNTPARWTVNAFKVVYYLKNLFSPLESLAAWKRRKQALRVSSPA
jgi:flavin-dependent dehydrogenase